MNAPGVGKVCIDYPYQAEAVQVESKRHSSNKLAVLIIPIKCKQGRLFKRGYLFGDCPAAYFSLVGLSHLKGYLIDASQT